MTAIPADAEAAFPTQAAPGQVHARICGGRVVWYPEPKRLLFLD
jgi:hypothetical protein